MKSETLEILIGKYLDGEITPAEQRVLETELKNNPHAGELLEQLRASLPTTSLSGLGGSEQEILWGA
ncbi:MAG: anti-sigma factor family protein [Planctomycetota bacterium]|jgi:anti-sigma factor RsiW